MSNKIIRSICVFDADPNIKTLDRLDFLSDKLKLQGYVIQTKRICSPIKQLKDWAVRIQNKEILLSSGTFAFFDIEKQLQDFLDIPNLSLNVDLSPQKIDNEHVDLLFSIINSKAEKTFDFAYVFNNQNSSPYFPSANYEHDGFSIGLQSTDLSEGCKSLDQWFENMNEVWQELNGLLSSEKGFLGVDSSVAPLFSGKSSLINYINGISSSFSQSVLSDTYLQITKFIKEKNPNPVGLCGLMFPCLEDFELADEYEQGNFSLERNLFLSLHSGLGIDTYPIGINEDRTRVLEILQVIQGLSNKYNKPLSIRFVSDGKAKIGERTSFSNQYLKDVTIRAL